jgi:hypothetical protein
MHSTGEPAKEEVFAGHPAHRTVAVHIVWARGWVTYKPHNLISHSSWGWRSMVRILTELVLLEGCCVLTEWMGWDALWSHLWGPWSHPFMRFLSQNLVTFHKPHLPISSPWWLDFYLWILDGCKHLGHSTMLRSMAYYVTAWVENKSCFCLWHLLSFCHIPRSKEFIAPQREAPVFLGHICSGMRFFPLTF